MSAQATAARAVVTGEGGALLVRDIEVAAPLAGEVRVQIAASGVCHTDSDLRGHPGIVLGHEGAGIVEAVGPGVTSISPGDRVLLNWAMPCGRCFQCVEGNEHLCEVGSPLFGGTDAHAHRGNTTVDGVAVDRAFGLGTLSSVTLVPDRAVTPLPDDVPFTSAAIVGCAVMTGVGSVINAARVPAGASVVVIGCGGVGLNVVQAARIVGATSIVAVDVRPERLDMARTMGATEVALADRDDASMAKVAAFVRAHTGGRGADFAFECTAVAALGAAPLAMIRHGGMAVQVSGIEQSIEVDMQLFEFDKTYINPLYGQCRPSRDFPRLFALYRRGDLLIDELVTRTYALDEIATAFDDLLAGRNAKGVVIFE